MKIIAKTFLLCVSLTLIGCEGGFESVYDTAPETVTPTEGRIVVDASDWANWYYIDLKELQRLSEEGDREALRKALAEHTPYPIPMTLTGGHDGRSGQYLYWFDVWGEGVKHNEYRGFTPCDAQPEPDEWTFAVHRDNVRTNGGAAYETAYTSIADLPPTDEILRKATFVEDEWSENEVWSSQEQMLQCLVPSQGIRINKVLSSWLTMDIPPMPPSFTMNSHVFMLRLKDNTCAALQLANYISPSGAKCFLTINYKYPV